MGLFKEYLLEKEPMKKELIEKLSELEHEQWISWAKDIQKNLEELLNGSDESKSKTRERLKRWKTECFKPYSELTEEMKEYDREWARKVLDIVK